MFKFIKTGRIISYLLISIIITLLTGCSKQRKKTIINLDIRKPDTIQIKNNVTLETKKLTEKEFNSIFYIAPATKLKKFFKKYDLIEIKISNNSDNEIIFNKSNIIINQQSLIERSLKHTHKKSIITARIIRGLGKLLLAVPIIFISGIAIRIIKSKKNVSNVSFEELALAVYFGLITVPITIITGAASISTKVIKKNRDIRNKKLNKVIENNILDKNKEYVIEKKEKLTKIYIIKKGEINRNLQIKLCDIKDDSLFNFLIPTN